MVSSSTVRADLSAMNGYFSNYSSQMDSLDNTSIWQGPSKDNAMNLSSNFVSTYKTAISSQMDSFSSALDKYESYKSAKQSRASALSSASSAEDSATRARYNDLASQYYDSMVEYERDIKSLLSSVTSQVCPAAESTVEAYANLVTINDFVYYFQTDYKQAYGRTSTIASSGCGPTSMAMVLTYLMGEEITPIDTARYSEQHGYRVEGNGTYAGLFPAMAAEYGLNCTQENPTAQNIINSLSEGNIIIAHMGPGTFTKGGHYIVLKGLDANGNVIIADPASRDRTNQTYPASLIANESKASMYSISN